MDSDVRRWFHKLADLPREERGRVLSSAPIEPEVRAEVESLLRFDDQESERLTDCISRSAAQMLGAVEDGRLGLCGPYRLLRLLGSGGMGSVYLAERTDGELERQVAIKLLRADSQRPGWRERFLKERQLLASLNHPSIVRVLDAGHTQDGLPYLVMEYVDGTPVDVAASKLDLRGSLALFARVCDGVAHAHRHLIIHRDLKPSNILVDPSGQPKILDFGIAKLLDDTADATQTAERLLTPNYASPEQVAGGTQTTATDIYSLGAILYKILTGRSPHESETGASRAMEVAAGTREIRDARRLNRKLPADLDYVLRKALRREPEQRYVAAEALADDVRASIDSRPVQARSGDSWYRTRKFLRRYWIPLAAAALVMTSLAAGLFVANRSRVVAERRFDQLRQLSNGVLDLDQAIRSLPNSISARQRLVTTSLAYLEGLAADARGDQDLTKEVARGYWRVALIQGVPTEVNLGQFGEAEKSLSKAEQLLEPVLASRPNDSGALSLAASVAEDRMILAESQRRNAEAQSFAQQAAGRLDALLRVGHASDSEIQDAGVTYSNIALAEMNMHRYGEAVGYARKSIEIFRAVGAARNRVGQGLSVLASAYRFQGDLDGAVRAIEEALDLADQSGSSNITQRMFDAYGILLREGQILGEDGGVNAGRPADAIGPLQRAVDLSEEVARRDPKDFTSRSRVGTSARLLANIVRYRDPRRALTLYDLALKRLGEIPHNLKAQRDMAGTLADSSYVLLTLHRGMDAGRRVDQALTILTETKDYPASRVALDSDLYSVLSARGDYAAATGDPEHALGLYQQLLDAVMAAKPDAFDDLRDAPRLSRLYQRLAELERQTGNLAKSQDMAARRLDLWQQWDRKLPDNAFIRRQLDAAGTR